MKKSNSAARTIAGVGMTAILTMIFALYSARLVMQFCPRGENCEQMGQALFGLGLIASFVLAGAIVLVGKTVIDRWLSPGR